MADDDAPSGVMVRVAGGATVDKHPTGTNFTVVDGHLCVHAGFTSDIAIYAPGAWTRVKRGNTDRWADTES